jgi:hypothetical protein
MWWGWILYVLIHGSMVPLRIIRVLDHQDDVFWRSIVYENTERHRFAFSGFSGDAGDKILPTGVD